MERIFLMKNPTKIVNWLCLARFLIGCYFAVSGVSKLARPYEEFLFVVQGYALLPPMAEDWLARLLPWVEAVGGVFLLAGLWTRQTLTAILGLCTIFILALASVLYRQLSLEDCGCIAIGVNLSPKMTLVVDVLMWLVLAIGRKNWRKMQRFGVDEYFERRQAADKSR